MHTDQWSFCVGALRTLERRRAFTAKTTTRSCAPSSRKIRRPWPRIMAGDRPGIPICRRIHRRGLKKDPGQRWGSMRELGEALAHWLLARGIGEDCTGKSLRRNWLREEQSGRLGHFAAAGDAREAGAAVDHSFGQRPEAHLGRGGVGQSGRRPAPAHQGVCTASVAQKTGFDRASTRGQSPRWNTGGDPVELLKHARRAVRAGPWRSR